MNELGGYEFVDLRVGMCATFAKTVTEADIVLFAAVSGDNNAIHINEEFAAGTIFKGCIPMDCCRGDRRGHIKDIVSIRQRPAAVEDGAAPGGHWEGHRDMCLQARHGQSIQCKVRRRIILPCASWWLSSLGSFQI
jgi:hypothetical protein